ncbi:MAG TPA: hypothetical protein VGU01_05225 [Sphingomicrobium sp.]|nr:hypothetical protein [Sphingomicrobium sp.]
MIKRFTSIIGAVLCLSAPATADVIHVSVGARLTHLSFLVPGKHRYLRYLVKPDGSRTLVDIWTRSLSFERAPQSGERQMRIQQRWERPDGSRVIVQDSRFEAQTFRPLTHVLRIEQPDKEIVRGFRFKAREVTGMAELASNDRLDFKMPQSEEHYNFEYDMELLQTLPFAAGREFNIPFYDAGIDKQPDRYDFKVAGSAHLRGPDGQIIDCWLVTADYKTGKVVSRFWFAKKNQVLVREAALDSDGVTHIKTLLPPEPQDELDRDDGSRAP